MNITERIYSLCSEQGKMVKDVCDLLHIRSSTVSSWRTNGRNPPAEYLPKIAEFLGVSVHFLITGEELPAPRYTTPEQDELLSLFSLLPENKRYEFIGELKGYIKAANEASKYADSEKRFFA